MARPPLFTDDEIIATGEMLRATGPVTAARLWVACGRRGRLDRYATVWERHEAEQRHAAAEGPATGVIITLPEKAQCLATALKNDLSLGIDRVMSSIYLATEDAQKSRFQADLSQLNAARDAYRREVQDAFAALEEMSEALAESQERVGQLEVTLAAALTQRDINEALRAAVAQQQEGTLARLRDVESELKAEALSSAGLTVELVRAEMARDAADRALLESKAALDVARQTTAEASAIACSTQRAPTRHAGSGDSRWRRLRIPGSGRRLHKRSGLSAAGESEPSGLLSHRHSPASATIETLWQACMCSTVAEVPGPSSTLHTTMRVRRTGAVLPLLSSDEQEAPVVMAGRRP